VLTAPTVEAAFAMGMTTMTTMTKDLRRLDLILSRHPARRNGTRV